MSTVDPRVAAAFGPHGVPAAFQSLDGFGIADEGDDVVFPFDDCCLAGPDDAEAWVGDSPTAEVQAQLHVWLRGHAGFLYAFWSHDGRPMLEAPIVYLDDEGSGNSVVANDLDEFLGMMANGFERLCPEFTEPGEDELPEEPEEFFTHRGIAPLADWQARMEAAIAAHPDFDAWLTAQLG